MGLGDSNYYSPPTENSNSDSDLSIIADEGLPSLENAPYSPSAAVTLLPDCSDYLSDSEDSNYYSPPTENSNSDSDLNIIADEGLPSLENAPYSPSAAVTLLPDCSDYLSDSEDSNYYSPPTENSNSDSDLSIIAENASLIQNESPDELITLSDYSESDSTISSSQSNASISSVSAIQLAPLPRIISPLSDCSYDISSPDKNVHSDSSCSHRNHSSTPQQEHISPNVSSIIWEEHTSADSSHLGLVITGPFHCKRKRSLDGNECYERPTKKRRISWTDIISGNMWGVNS